MVYDALSLISHAQVIDLPIPLKPGHFICHDLTGFHGCAGVSQFTGHYFIAKDITDPVTEIVLLRGNVIMKYLFRHPVQGVDQFRQVFDNVAIPTKETPVTIYIGQHPGSFRPDLCNHSLALLQASFRVPLVVSGTFLTNAR
jgi:hypothetical protein